MGVRPANEYRYLVIASPVGAYFKGGIKPVSVWLSTEYVRACPGGTGAAKFGGNYAASLLAQAQAIENDCDQVVWLGCEGKRDELKQKLRILKIKCTPHRKRLHNGRDGPEQGEFLLIATDLLDLPAEVVGLIYRCRWTVEIFFRFFKHVLGCRHLLSHREDGIKIQVYMAIIACMLITLWSGRKPTLRTVEMMQFYFTGWASEEELDAHIAKLKKQGE